MEKIDDIKAYLKEHENKQLLRFITCGNVDDGKSTLIGRLSEKSKRGKKEPEIEDAEIVSDKPTEKKNRYSRIVKEYESNKEKPHLKQRVEKAEKNNRYMKILEEYE